jgi:hypothetical protein
MTKIRLTLSLLYLSLTKSAFCMARLFTRIIDGRLGRFYLLKIDSLVLFTSCYTRMKIIEALSERAMTADELAKATGTAYSTVIDHMDFLEKTNIVECLLDKEGCKKTTRDRRKAYFKLSRNLDRKVGMLFKDWD